MNKEWQKLLRTIMKTSCHQSTMLQCARMDKVPAWKLVRMQEKFYDELVVLIDELDAFPFDDDEELFK